MATGTKVKTASTAQVKGFGVMKPTIAVHVNKQTLQRDGVLHLKKFQDDLDKYEADFVFVDDIPVIVHRYASNAKDEYIVLVDCAKAVENGKDPWKLSDDLLSALGVSHEKVVWKNADLAKFLKLQKQATASKSRV
jgi:hypothetical protein